MAPTSRGSSGKGPKVVKPVKRGPRTKSTQNHRYEPFSRRIASLQIKPIKLNAKDRAHANLEDEQSHFRIALEEWQERNMSTPFIDFAEVVEPLCQNLPQVIHYEGQIVDAILGALPKGDTYSLEPMLGLTVQLAYDIGPRFEAYFERLVRAVSSIAATHTDVEVIEWSFNCLAALLKHFERLLAQDLKPLYDLMAPLLGRERQKPFVCRFAAEAFSFLIRKTASSTEASNRFLDAFTRYVMEDLQKTPSQQVSRHQQSVMAMFADAMKGVQSGLRIGAPAVLRSLLTTMHILCADGESGSILVRQTIEGILTAIVHYTNAAGFAPALDVLVDHAHQSITCGSSSSPTLSAQVIYTAVSVRKGTRIQSSADQSEDKWSSIFDILEALVPAVANHASGPDTVELVPVTNLLAVSLQYCPTEYVPRVSTIVENVTGGCWEHDFIRFCIFTSDLGAERFDLILRTHFQSFVVRHWSQKPGLICTALPRTSHHQDTINAIATDLRTQEGILSDMEDLVNALEVARPVEDSKLYLINRFVDIVATSRLVPRVRDRFATLMRRFIDSSLSSSISGLNTPITAFALCKCLGCFISQCGAEQIDAVFRDRLLNASKSFGNYIGYLKAFQKRLSTRHRGSGAQNQGDQLLIASLIENLCSPTEELRLMSLEMLAELCANQRSDVPQSLAVALTIERSSFDVDNMRAIALNVRKLGMSLHTVNSAPWTGKAVVAYCFGLLHVRLTPVWNDVCDTLSSLCSSGTLEDEIMSRCVGHVRKDSDTEQNALSTPSEELPWVERTSEFQCTNFMQLKQISERSAAIVDSVPEALKRSFEIDNGPSPRTSGADRSQALRVLAKLASTAEKRSRVFVPVFFDWFGADNEDDVPAIQLDSDDDTLPDQPSTPPIVRNHASRDDKKGMLKVFAGFVNPSVLFRSEEVHSTLLRVLGSGDTDIQRLALKALLAWKSPATIPYEENLVNLLDDAHFRNELTVFLGVEVENSVIRVEHIEGLMPVLLRLLYGRSIARTGKKGRGGQNSRRQAILLSLARFGHGVLGQFISIALHPLDSLHVLLMTDPPRIDEEMIRSQKVSPRKQLGLVRMIHAILDALPNIVSPFASQLMEVLLLCLIQCHRQLPSSSTTQPQRHAAVEHESLIRAVRQEGLKSLELLFVHCPKNDWTSYVPVLLEEVLLPRLENLPIETAQGVSAILRLLSVWASSSDLVYILLDRRTTAIERVAQCLTVPSAQDEVKIFVLKNIIAKLLELARAPPDGTQGSTALLNARLHGELAQTYLNCITELLANDPSKEVLEAGTDTITSIAPFLESSSQVGSLIQTSIKLLSPGVKRIHPHIKSRLLNVLEQYLPKCTILPDSQLFMQSLDTLSALFSYFLDGPSRVLLARVFFDLVAGIEEYESSARLCQQLNAFSSSKLQELDYDTRLQAFDVINGSIGLGLNVRQWRPIVHNLLFLLKDDSQFSSLRSSASQVLCRFVRVAVGNVQTDNDKAHGNTEMSNCIDRELLPPLCRGMRETSEPVRLEYLNVIVELVKLDYPSTQDMKPLLGSDSDTSFFDGILHIQQQRRLLALRKLASSAQHISSSNISRIFLPLLETVLANGDSDSQAVTDESIRTLDAVVECLEWDKCRYYIQRMIGEKTRFDSKQSIRILGAAVNALYRAHLDRLSDRPVSTALQKTLPRSEALSKALNKGCLSRLLEYTHFRDESAVDLRINVATTAVKVIMTFTPEEISAQLPSLLIDVCNILRSKAQEARDAARKTLAEIAALVGASYFGFLIKQLKSSLQRGTQLHVMSYTVHSLLVAATPQFKPGDIDYCLHDIMTIVMEDVFGNVGQEKESQGFTSKMREVRKKALGYDSLELISSFTPPQRVGALLRPIQSQLAKPKPRLEKVDELLRRVREGLRRNESFNNRQALTLCYEVLRDSLHGYESTSLSTSPARYKIASFAMDLLRRVVDRHENLKSRDNLQGFMPLLTKSLSLGQVESQVSAMRLLTSIVKVPIVEMDQSAGEYMNFTKQILEGETSTQTPLAQAALRLISALLRERPNAVINQSEFEDLMAYMLKRVRPDLHEPAHSHERGRQVAAFNLLKAVLGRGVLITQIYEVMDTVREVMVTSPEQEIRSSARAVYSRFVLDYYPKEGKGFVKQMDFLKQNLQYEQPHGRQSVMEVIDYIVYKKGDNHEAVQLLVLRFWQDLLDLLVTETVQRSHDVARLLLVKLFGRADSDTRRTMKSQLSKLVDSSMASLLQRAGYRGWDAYFEADDTATREAEVISKQAQAIIESTQPAMKRGKAAVIEDVLQVYARLCELFPNHAFSKSSTEAWQTIPTSGATSSHYKIRLGSLRLLNAYLEHFVKSFTRGQSQHGLPLIGAADLQLDHDEVTHVIASSTAIFKEEFDQATAAQAANIVGTIMRLPLGADTQRIVSQLLSQLSSMIRQEAAPPQSKLVALKLLTSVCNRQPDENIKPAMQDMLFMLSNLTDTAVAPAFGDEEVHEQLSDAASEMLDLLKSKLGSSEFVRMMQQVQSAVRERREERKAKRSIQTVSQPELAGKEKVRKGAAKRTKRKERNEVFAGRRRGY